MYKLLSFLLASLPVICLGQGKEELIHWAQDQRLTWKDYKGSADRNAGAAASTATYLGIDYNFSPKGLTYKITCSFSKNKSWGLHKTEYILGHEQGHFDIAEIFARKLNKKMAVYKFNPDTYKSDLRKIYEDIIYEKEEMQNAYDAETNHSIEKQKQEEWLKKIELLLEEYKAYAGYS
jgi:hypothetical protein